MDGSGPTRKRRSRGPATWSDQQHTPTHTVSQFAVACCARVGFDGLGMPRKSTPRNSISHCTNLMASSLIQPLKCLQPKGTTMGLPSNATLKTGQYDRVGIRSGNPCLRELLIASTFGDPMRRATLFLPEIAGCLLRKPPSAGQQNTGSLIRPGPDDVAFAHSLYGTPISPRPDKAAVKVNFAIHIRPKISRAINMSDP